MDETTASEDLAWIRSMVTESQTFLGGTWRHQLAWGLLGSAGLSITWGALATGRYGLIPWSWVVVVASGWTYSLVIGRRSGPVRNLARRAFGAIWMALGVTLTLLGTVTLVAGAMIRGSSRGSSPSSSGPDTSPADSSLDCGGWPGSGWLGGREASRCSSGAAPTPFWPWRP